MKTIKKRKSSTHTKTHELRKREFVGIASHQLRTPLTTINWYVEMLRNGDAGKLSPVQKSYLKEVSTGVGYMVRMINELLDATQSESGCITVCVPHDHAPHVQKTLRQA
jgi:signal transduction histidine kinase